MRCSTKIYAGVVGLAMSIVSGCGVSSLGRVPPPDTALWSKQGIDYRQFIFDLEECHRASDAWSAANAPGYGSYKVQESCMYEKGYLFTNTQPSGWGDYCAFFPDGPVCDGRGQITSEPPPSPPTHPSHKKPVVVPQNQQLDKVTPQVQKDSSNQMNQLLEGANPRK